MAIITIPGLISSSISILLAVFLAYRAKPEAVKRPGDVIVFLLFQLALASSVWGVGAPRIGSMFTTYRVSTALFFIAFFLNSVLRWKNPFHKLSRSAWALLSLFAAMAVYSILTFLFLAIDRSFTFSRGVNLAFDIILAVMILLYCNTKPVLRSVMYNLTTLVITMGLLGVYECFFPSFFCIVHEGYVGQVFFGLGNLNLPVLSYLNTNDYCAALFFIAMPAIIYWLHCYFTGKGKHMPVVISSMLCIIWFVAHCSGAILVQIAMLIFFFVMCIGVLWNRKRFFLSCVMPILFAGVLILSLTVSIPKLIHHPEFRPLATTTPTTTVSPTGTASPTANVSPVDPGNPEPTSNMTGIGVHNDSMNRSFQIRKTLLGFCFSTLKDSKGLGVGLGNTEKLAEMSITDRTGGVSRLHCYGAECMADFGLFFILPALAFLVFYLIDWFGLFKRYRACRDHGATMLLLLMLATFPCMIFLSTAPGCAQDLKGMWIFIGLTAYLTKDFPYLLASSPEMEPLDEPEDEEED